MSDVDDKAADGLSLWDFSIRVYGEPGVADACLNLQDHNGADVNLLLYCCWLGSHRRPLTADRLPAIVEATRPWAENVIRPLRRARRWLKSSTLPSGSADAARVGLREQIKRSELEAEHLQQTVLEQLTQDHLAPQGPGDSPAAIAASNLAAYLSLAEIRADAAVLAGLTVLLDAALDDTRRTEIVAALASAFPRAEERV